MNTAASAVRVVRGKDTVFSYSFASGHRTSNLFRLILGYSRWHCLTFAPFAGDAPLSRTSRAEESDESIHWSYVQRASSDQRVDGRDDCRSP